MKIKLILPLAILWSVQLFAQLEVNRNDAFSAYSGQVSQAKTVLPNNPMQASNLRSDTVDILKYTINLNITSFADSTISGNTQVKFAPKVNGVNKLNLDLLRLHIDSVKSATTLLTYTYNDTLLGINLPVSYNMGDTAAISVYYHGHPSGDSSGWGGFYFTATYAYNLGVGFAALPHNYGRVWFPCFDNFVERSLFEFNITTNNGKIAYCNGYLAHDTTDGNGNRTRQWVLDKQIPSYLACVSVAPYAQINTTFAGINGPVPVSIAALPADTTNVKNAFINLPLAFATWENHFGPYRWNKVGYTMVPFSSGAMEHATSISYPLVVTSPAYGTMYQNIMAHELSHHWFGDLATCRKAEEMWLNEGWAHYCEFLFYEALNGYNSYLTYVKINHANNLQFIHNKEGGYQTLSNIPQTYTYGDHVYNKGADVAHTMRSYMGDSLFYSSLKTYLNSHQYTDVSSLDFRDALTAASGINMTDFFDNWVLHPGWCHFSIDSTVVTPSGSNYNVAVYVKQKLTGAPAYFTNVPLEVTFKAANWTQQTQAFVMSGPSQVVNFTVPFHPVFVAENMSCKISDAIVSDYQTIKTIGNKSCGYTKMTLAVSAVTDSAFIRVEHNFTAPDSYKSCCIPYRLSPNHYWKVDGIIPAGFRAKATLPYDGRTISGGAPYFAANYWLDNLLIGTELEDSLVLMYRKNAAAEWAIYPYYTKNIQGLNNDKHGTLIIDSLQKGEYVFAMSDFALGVKNVSANLELPSLKVYPNPANDLVTVDLASTINKSENNATLQIMDIAGKIISKEKLSQQQSSVSVTTSTFSSGLYFAVLKTTNGIVAKNKFLVAH